jgi:hypothetical protein
VHRVSVLAREVVQRFRRNELGSMSRNSIHQVRIEAGKLLAKIVALLADCIGADGVGYAAAMCISCCLDQ